MKENEKIEKYLDLPPKLKKLRNVKVTVIPIVVGGLGIVLKILGKRLEELENHRRIETLQDHSIVKIG